MSIRTDLAVEALPSSAPLPEGAEKRELRFCGIPCTLVEIRKESAARALQKPPGRYYTLHCPVFSQTAPEFPALVEALARVISLLLPKEGAVLTAGLGNASITPDALGPETVRYLLATRHIDPSSMPPGLPPLRPAAVIAVDALAAGSLSRLGATVQVCDSGIAPGSGVANRRKELSRRTLGVPVVAVGVPTVADYAREDGPPMMVTPREIDAIIHSASKAIAYAVDRALQPSLSLEDLAALSD